MIENIWENTLDVQDEFQCVKRVVASRRASILVQQIEEGWDSPCPGVQPVPILRLFWSVRWKYGSAQRNIGRRIIGICVKAINR